ncbi:MAG: AAA family ATPase [Candidatus Dormibacteria bacterium]
MAPGLPTQGSALGITGPTGAPGRTFLSINLALALRAEGMSVALVDADPHLGCVAVQLDLAEDRSLVYLAHEATLKAVDDELISRHLQPTLGLDVLAGRSVAVTGEIVAGALLRDVLHRLRRRYDVVVVDIGALECRASQSTALECQMLVWAMVSTKVGADLLDRTLSSPLASQVRTRPSLVVVNRLGTPSLRDVDSGLRRRYGMAVAAAIPDDRRACVAAEDNARPAVLRGSLAPSLRRCGRTVAAALLRTASGPRLEVEGERSLSRPALMGERP